jgi:signal transduction histidine kinase
MWKISVSRNRKAARHQRPAGKKMDKKASNILIAAKYAGYLVTLWIAAGNRGISLDGPLLPFLLVFTVDNIRSFYLENKNRRLAAASLYLQMVFILAFVLTGGSFIASILFTILIAESLIIYKRPLGDRIFMFSILFFLAGSAVDLFRMESLSWDMYAGTFVNSLFLFFAYGVSYLARRQIEEKVRAETAILELQRSQRELELANLRLMDGSKQREQLAVTEERNRLAREIHDTLAHTLTTVIVGLEAGKKLLDIDMERAREELLKSQRLAREGLDEIRRSVRALLPRTLDEQGFIAALRGLASELGKAGAEVKVMVEEGVEVPRRLELPLYRVAQESITNSTRHGCATAIIIKLYRHDSALRLEISDNGSGCSSFSEGYGIKGMRTRMAAVGGRVEFINQSPGFLVRAEVEEGLYYGED